MSNFITMYDATDAPNLPSINENALDVAVASYVDGSFANGWIDCIRKYPVLARRQRVLSIGNRFSTIARIIDYEQGNPCYGDPDGVARWVLAMLAHGVYMPGGYADRADMPAIQEAYVRHNVPRDRTSLWIAAPGAGGTTLDPTPLLNAGFNSVQCRFAGAFDVSVCKADFFPSLAPPPPPKPKPKLTEGTLRFAGELDTVSGQWAIQGEPGHGITWGTDKRKWASKLTVQNDDGHWSVTGLPFE